MDELNTTPIENEMLPKEEPLVELSPLTLNLDDQDVVSTTDNWYRESRTFFKDKYNLYERRKKNEMYLFGRQIDDKENKHEFKNYEARFMDNVLYEIEASLKPLAMSRLPDMIVTPGNDTPESRETADDVSSALDTDMKKRENRQVLGIGFKHLPVYYTAVIKVRWNPEVNDYVFDIIHPDYIDVDHTCNTKNADDMKWIAHTLPISVQECVMRFPGKKKELFDALIKDGIDVGTDEKPKTKGLLSEIKIREIWFDWYTKKEDKWEKVSAVMWKYKDVVLKKIKNPNFDYKGESRYYSVDPETNDKREVTEEYMMQFMATGMLPENITQEKLYRNYFDSPRKPFFFLGYDQWRKIPYDETSRIEQNIRNQENLDKRGKSIIEKLMARVKHVFSKDGGLKKEDIEQMDLDDNRQDLLVDGDVNKVHGVIVPEQPTSQEFKDLDDTRNRMYSLSGATAIRGQLQSDVATSNQIAREADFTRSDDLVEDTINDAVEWMAQWALHFIKLRYTEDHFRKLSGARGSVTFVKLNRDLIEDGMEVTIKASGTDKLKTQKTAMEMAGMQMIDPVNLFRDMGLSDPEGRAEDLMMFTTDPASYIAKIKGLGSTPQELAATLKGIPQQGQMPPSAPPTPEAQGMPPVGQPSPMDTTNIAPTPVGPPEGSPRLL